VACGEVQKRLDQKSESSVGHVGMETPERVEEMSWLTPTEGHFPCSNLIWLYSARCDAIWLCEPSNHHTGLKRSASGPRYYASRCSIRPSNDPKLLGMELSLRLETTISTGALDDSRGFVRRQRMLSACPVRKLEIAGPHCWRQFGGNFQFFQASLASCG
jgi:hypothetical protein